MSRMLQGSYVTGTNSFWLMWLPGVKGVPHVQLVAGLTGELCLPQRAWKAVWLR